MNKYTRLLTSLSLFLILTFEVSAQTTEAYPVEIQQKIIQVESNLRPAKDSGIDTTWSISERMNHYNVPAVSIAVVDNFELVWTKAYGFADKETKVPATTETLFQAASISKSLNALGVLRWAETYKMDLEIDINMHPTSWQFQYGKKSNGKTISLAHLLSHTAGISAHGFGGYQTGMKLPSVHQILDGKKPANSDKVKSLFEPGIKFKYSGGGTIITQLILSESSGMPYDKYMKEKVLDPLGMKNSSYTQPPSIDAPLATGHWVNGTPLKGKYHIYPEMAAAGLWTNPTDLSYFIIEMQKSLLGKSNKILSREMTEKMLTPYLKDGITGLGVFFDKKENMTYFNHGGSNEGFKCIYYGSMEDGDGLVIMVNSESFDIIPEIIRSIAKVHQWVGFY